MLRRVRVEGAAAAHAARAFGFSRPAFYQAARSFQSDGIAGLLPAKRGPKGGHKLSDDVLDWVRSKLESDPSQSTQALADMVLDEFGVEVHPRSIARAIARYEKKNALTSSKPSIAPCPLDAAARYEQLRAGALDGSWPQHMGLAALLQAGMRAWLEHIARPPRPPARPRATPRPGGLEALVTDLVLASALSGARG